MGKPYLRDLRQRFAALLDRGLSASAAGRQLLVSRSTATRWGQIWHTENRAEALPMGGDGRSAPLEAEAPAILAVPNPVRRSQGAVEAVPGGQRLVPRAAEKFREGR